MYCYRCGALNPDNVANCTSCGTLIRPTFVPQHPAPPIEESAAMRMLLPVGRSGLAVIAGYLGLFAVLLVPAPLAILFGVLALRDIAAHPKKIGKGRAWFGIVMGVLGTAGLLAMLPTLVAAFRR